MPLTAALASAPRQPTGAADEASGYRPGVCNIGPEEIARRRRAGHVALIATVGLLVLLLALHAPALARLVVFVPAAGAAIGYLQAWFRFCAGFGARGVYNFGRLGRTDSVADAESVARDRATARRLALTTAAIGAVVAIVAVLLPT